MIQEKQAAITFDLFYIMLKLFGKYRRGKSMGGEERRRNRRGEKKWE